MTSVDGMEDSKTEICQAYLKARGDLEALKARDFAPGTVVYVENRSNRGYGVVVPSELGDGNASVRVLRVDGERHITYLGDCTPESRPGRWPAWVVEFKKQK